MKDVVFNSLTLFPVFLAPMAGVTDSAFRRLARSMGCGLVFSEMVSVPGLLYQRKGSQRLLAFREEERPLGVQLFGSSPLEMARAAALIEEEVCPDLLDINMGCPVKKVVKTGAGAALMKNPSRAVAMAKAVFQTVGIPVTVKLRVGWDNDSINVLELAPLLEEAGVSSLTIHGRTREDLYGGEANWEIIQEVKRRVSIPVIGNGDIFTLNDFIYRMEHFSVDGVMIGRGARGNPWLFRQIKEYLFTGEKGGEPSSRERVQMAVRHLHLLVEDKGQRMGVLEMRKHAGWYLKGLPGAKALKVAVNKAETRETMEGLLLEYNHGLAD